MSDLKSILAEEYEKQNSEVTVESLMEMVEEVLDELYDTVVVPKVSEAKMKQEQAKQFLLSLPKFSPSEAWGDPNSMERQQIQQIFNVIGGGRSVRGKLEFLQKIADPNSRIRLLFSNLLVLLSTALTRRVLGLFLKVFSQRCCKGPRKRKFQQKVTFRSRI
jgi:hypothetical protein